MMGNLIKTEWLKIKKYKAFWWMTLMVALSYPGMNYFMYRVVYKEQANDPSFGPILAMIGNPFTFPNVWHTVAFISSWFVFIPSVVVIMFITNEYTYKTHRQNIIDGWSRNEFMISKMIDVFVVSLLITVMYLLVAVIMGSVNAEGSSANVWEGSKYIWLFFAQTFSQLSIAFLIAFLARKAFIALGIFLFYFIILEPTLVGLSRWKLNDAGRFLPLEISDRLIPLPRFFIKDADQWQSLMDAANRHFFYTIIVTALTWFLCFRLNKKRDL